MGANLGVWLRVALSIALVGFCTGCINLGPKVIQTARADYNTVLHDTRDQQLLANLVRLRYRDRPFFLEVSAVTTQYTFSPQLTASAALGPSSVEQEGITGAGVTYAETPTISYTPLQGEDFARRLLTPVAPEALLLLSNSGWSIDRLLRICVQRINGVPNAVTASGPTPSAAPVYAQFHRLSQRLRELQLSGDISFGYLEGEGRVPALMFSANARSGPAYAEIVEMLGLPPGQSYYRLSSSLGRSPADGIVIQTRSLNGILYYLSHAVAVPAAHQSAGLVTLTRSADGGTFDWSALMQNLFSIEVSEDKPRTAAVRVPYRGHWYYLADTDLSSKSTFSLLTQLFALQAGGAESLQPVLTVPVGR